MRVVLVEPVDTMRARAREYLHRHLEKNGSPERMHDLVLAADLESLSGVQVVIEAVPEDLDLKRAIFRQLDVLCSPPAVLATNTSTLSVSAIAAAASSPERVAGMHFFNPAPVLSLVEIIRARQTGPDALQALLELARRLGKTPIVARDTPGFVVNRVARPFYAEALRLLAEGTAEPAAIDSIVERGGGFRLGPFRLMDLIGNDVNFAATRSMYEQTFGEPRYRPHWIQGQMVQEGRLGRKAGRGFYEYIKGAPSESSARVALPVGPAQGTLSISMGTWAPGLEDLARQAGYLVQESAGPGVKAGFVTAGRAENAVEVAADLDRDLPLHAPLFCQTADVAVSEFAARLHHPDRLVGFDGWFLASGAVATLVAWEGLSPQARDAAEAIVRTMGREPIWTREAPGLVLPRIVSMLANEAAFAMSEGVAEAGTIDLAMRLGTNYPLGPLEWGQALGWPRVLAVLDHLREETGEARYRAAPWLRRKARMPKA
jgi:3-hydroxybutyryl-CoA dehydrogenase